jgi:tetratricopeptide (TPR) repeat protein
MTSDGLRFPPPWTSGIDIPGLPFLVAPARRVLAVVTAFDHAEKPAAVVAAHADISTSSAERHLRNLSRLGLVQPGKADPGTYQLGSGPRPLMPAVLSNEGYSRATAWHLANVFEAARVLGADALPRREEIRADPDRPGLVPSGRGQALAWFAAERENLVREVELAKDLGDPEQAWRLALLMLNISCFAGTWTNWRTVFDLGIRAARRDRAAAAQGMLFEFKGKLELTDGDPVAARNTHALAVTLRGTADPAASVRSINALGVTWLRERVLPDAERLFQEALDLALEFGDEEFETFAQMNLGAVYARAGRTERAVELLQTAITALRAAGRDQYVANAFEDLAAAYRLGGDLIAAKDAALEAEGAAVAAGIPLFLPGPLCELATIEADLGHLRVALAHLHEALGIYRELGNEMYAAHVERRIETLAQRGGHDAVDAAELPKAGND